MSVAIPIRTNEPGTRYFTPRFVNIVVGETITWYNAGKDIHSLIFDTEIPPYDIKIGDVVPVSTLSKRFDFYVPRIDYSCATHPEEKGTIVIYEKNEQCIRSHRAHRSQGNGVFILFINVNTYSHDVIYSILQRKHI